MTHKPASCVCKHRYLDRLGPPAMILPTRFFYLVGALQWIRGVSKGAFYKQSILGRMRECEVCTYVRSLANQMNAMFHGSMNSSPWCIHLVWCVAATYTQQRSEAEVTLQVQGVIQTSLSSGYPTRASRRRSRPTRLQRREMCRLRCLLRKHKRRRMLMLL